MAVKHNNILLNLITGCLYWLTTCFGRLHDHHQVYKSYRIYTHTMQRSLSMERNWFPLCFTMFSIRLLYTIIARIKYDMKDLKIYIF